MRYLDNGEPLSKNEKTIFATLTKKESEVKNIAIGGIPGIKSVKTSKKFVMNAPLSAKTDLNAQQKEDYEYVTFETDGTNLRACLSHPMIDSRKTYSNDMNEIYQLLGIEAARQCFINEFK